MIADLRHFKMQEIVLTYKVLKQQLQEQVNLKERLNIKDTPDISYSDQENIFIIRFNRDTRRILAQINILDREIERRNKLVAVM